MTDTNGVRNNAGARASDSREERRSSGERRVITALFCDVVNSTSMAEQLDPEDWTEIMDDAFQHLTAPIHRYEGTVAKLMGDGMLAFFGAPAAHEDDPQRAILAALDIIDGIQPFREKVQSEFGLDFDVRVGINTGPVVVADIGSPRAMDHTAMGDAVNVAARMEQTASPGTVQISGDTYRFVAPLFDVEPLGEIELKGKKDPVPAFRVSGVKAEPGRLRGVHGVSAPLTGREREFTMLKDILARLQQGRGQILCLMGEAGIGKSRLLAELNRVWVEQGTAGEWFMLAGVPYDAARPYGVFQNFARGMFGVELDDPPEEVHRKVEASLRATGAPEEQVALCSVAFEHVIAARVLHEGKAYPAQVLKKDIYDNMYPGLARAARQAPAVLAIDDAQWADPASIELMRHLLALVEEVPVLFVCAFRPDRQSPAWRLKQDAETEFPHRYTEIVLKPLDEKDSDALVSELLSIADLPGELRRMILRKADGNPYFIEEIVRTLIDDGVVKRTDNGLKWTAAMRVEDIAIPDGLQALLMARIDRLDQETKSTLQLASVIGRSFYYRILEAISDSAIAIDKHLSSLERVELLREAGRLPELEYMFKHELARDAAYGSILNRRRRELHRRVAEAMEVMFADRLQEQAHRLAQHFALAGDDEKTRKYYEMAGDGAAKIHANAEAAAHFAHALDAARRTGAAANELDAIDAKRTAALVEAAR